MSDAPSGASQAASGGLLASLRRLGTTLIDIVQTRLELVAAEYEEERAWLHAALFYTIVAVFFFVLGAMLLTLFVILLFWDSHRLMAVGGAAAFYLIVAAGVWVLMRVRAKRRPRFLSATLSELAKDRAALRTRP